MLIIVELEDDINVIVNNNELIDTMLKKYKIIYDQKLKINIENKQILLKENYN